MAERSRARFIAPVVVVRARVPARLEGGALTAGDPVEVGWDPGDAVVVADDAPAPQAEPEPVHA